MLHVSIFRATMLALKIVPCNITFIEGSRQMRNMCCWYYTIITFIYIHIYSTLSNLSALSSFHLQFTLMKSSSLIIKCRRLFVFIYFTTCTLTFSLSYLLYLSFKYGSAVTENFYFLNRLQPIYYEHKIILRVLISYIADRSREASAVTT